MARAWWGRGKGVLCPRAGTTSERLPRSPSDFRDTHSFLAMPSTGRPQREWVSWITCSFQEHAGGVHKLLVDRKACGSVRVGQSDNLAGLSKRGGGAVPNHWMAMLALCFGLCWLAETRIVPRISDKIVLQRWWIPWAVIALAAAVSALIGVAGQLYSLPWLSKPVLTGLKMLPWYACFVLIGVFKWPHEAEPEPDTARSEPARPPGMQDPVISHRWWEKYH